MEVKTLRFSDVPSVLTEETLRKLFAKSGALSQLVLRDGEGYVEYKNSICANHAYINLRSYFQQQGATLAFDHEE